MTMDRSSDDALDWAIRVADPAFTDWDGFTMWLEGDPAHAERYDAAVTALTAIEHDLVMTPIPLAPPARPHRRPGPRWIGAAMAAAAVGAVGLGVWTQRPQPYVVETAAGTTRSIPLGDGSELVLAGGSRVQLDRRDPRVATLDRGDALFRVRHDARDPFRVRVGAVELTDLGTVFDVGLRDAVTHVAVAEGAVMVDPDGAAVRLDPGQAARIDGARIVRSTVDPADVGDWRQGRLSFDGTPLAQVAADLSRHMGIPIATTPAVAARTFRGTLDLGGLRRDPALLGALLGVRVRTTATRWTLEPAR